MLNAQQFNDGLLEDLQLEPFRQERGWFGLGYYTVRSTACSHLFSSSPLTFLLTFPLCSLESEPHRELPDQEPRRGATTRQGEERFESRRSSRFGRLALGLGEAAGSEEEGTLDLKYQSSFRLGVLMA